MHPETLLRLDHDATDSSWHFFAIIPVAQCIVTVNSGANPEFSGVVRAE
jgi:hypothetical protein